MIVSVMLAFATLTYSGSAAWVCPTLDASPNEKGVWEVVLGSFQRGYSGQQAGKMIAAEVQANCPEYIPLLLDWAEKNG